MIVMDKYEHRCVMTAEKKGRMNAALWVKAGNAYLITAFSSPFL
jgi:hypothetical protein